MLSFYFRSLQRLAFFSYNGVGNDKLDQPFRKEPAFRIQTLLRARGVIWASMANQGRSWAYEKKYFGPFVTPGNHLLQFNSKDFVLLLSEKSFDRILFLCLRIPGLDF
jgi:hypothetical protein